MGSSFHLHFMSLLLAVAAIHGGHSTKEVEFSVAQVAEDTEGGKLFLEEVGKEKVKQLMSAITTEIWGSVFNQSVDVKGKVHKISLFVHKIDREESYYRELEQHAYEIHLSAEHIKEHKGNVEKEIKMLLTYEITHVLQYTGGGEIPIALMDGIAAYVVIRLERKPSRWVNYGEGDIWDQSPQVTGQFLTYCSKADSNFVEKLNKKMENTYNKSYFHDILGKTLDELWKDYEAKHEPNHSHRTFCSLWSC